MDYFLPLKKLPLSFDLLIPFLRFNKELERELLLKGKKIFFLNEKIIVCENLISRPLWCQDWWPQTRLISIETRSEAVKNLKAQKNLGVFYNTTPEAQSALAASIRRDLRELTTKRIEYVVPSKFNFKYFSWSVAPDQKHLFLCENPDSRFPLGWHEFQEDKTLPPNRAYLKLWEVLGLGYVQLKPTDIALDLGSCPGGWSWALSQQIQKVYSVDKAPLAPEIAKIRSIIYQEQDAFKLNPADYDDCTWLFSDIICTPERLLSLVQQWMKESRIKNYVCTIKFKGDCDYDLLAEFQKIENSKIIHLYQNKNEVTWIKQRTS